MPKVNIGAGGGIDSVFQNAGIVDALITSSTVADNTTSEETAATLTIPAGMAVADTVFRVVAYGLMHNTSGSTVTYTIRLKIGGTTVFTSSPTKNSSGNRGHFRYQWDIACASATAQRIFSTFDLSSNVGSEGIDSDLLGVRAGYGESTVDMTLATTVAVTAQASAAGASVDVDFRSVTLGVMRPLP